MRKFILSLLAIILPTVVSLAQYSDHRGRNTDSLEVVVAGWTPEKLEAASKEESDRVISAYKDLMWGYLQVNRERSMMFARKALDLSMPRGYWYTAQDAARILGLHFYAQEQWDSATFFYNKGLEIVQKMEDKVTTPYSSKIYEQSSIDDARSAFYGSLGNMYNMMDSIPLAMEYYKKAGEIFEKNGWKESSSILWYNMGETWLEDGNLKEAEKCYQTSLKYARESGDSLQISNPLKGLGALYLQQGKTGKALECLEEADKYYSLHEDQEFRYRLETLDLMGKVLKQQKKDQRRLAIVAVSLAVLMLLLMILLRRSFILRRKNKAADEVIGEAIEDLSAKETPAGPGEDERPHDLALTDREMEILPLLAQGMTSPKIAEKLYLSLPTIKWYRKKLLIKFEASNTADLIYKAKEKGII